MLLSTVASFGDASTAPPIQRRPPQPVRCQDLALRSLHMDRRLVPDARASPARSAVDAIMVQGPAPGPGRGADSPSWGTGQRPVSCGANVLACRASVIQPRREA